MRFFALIIGNLSTIVAVAGALVIWFGWSASRLYLRTQGLIAVLSQGRTLIETAPNPRAFAASFETIAQQLAGLSVIAGPWAAYRDTLIVPEAPSRLVRSTLRPEQVFDLGLLRAAHINPRYHAAMSGLLVGAGLLFSFVGLTVALRVAGDVVANGDPAQSREGLHELLNAASFKFITSATGLLLSILYTWLRNESIRAVEQALDTFNGALEQQMPLATPAFLQHEANEALRDQSAALETFGTELAVNIGQALDRAFDQRLGEHIGPLTAAMQALAERTATQNQDAVQQMLQTFVDRLSGGTRDHISGVAENLAALGTRLEGLQTRLDEASARMSDSAEAMAARMGEGAEAALSRITNQMGGLMDTLRNVAAQTREAGAEAAQTLATRIEGAAMGFEAAAMRMTETLAQAAVGSGEAIARGAGEAAEGLGAAATGMRKMLDSTGEALARQATALAATAEALAARVAELDRATRDAVSPFAAGAADLRRAAEAAQSATAPLRLVAAGLGTAVEQLNGAAQRFEAAQAGAGKLAHDIGAAAQRFEGVDTSLANTLHALSAGLDEFRRKIQEFVTDTNGDLSKAATHISAAVNEPQEVLEPRNFVPA